MRSEPARLRAVTKSVCKSVAPRTSAIATNDRNGCCRSRHRGRVSENGAGARFEQIVERKPEPQTEEQKDQAQFRESGKAAARRNVAGGERSDCDARQQVADDGRDAQRACRSARNTAGN